MREVLSDKNANVNAKDNDGKTPLALCPPASTHVIEILKSKGTVM